MNIVGSARVRRVVKKRPTHPWACECMTDDDSSNSRVLVCKTNPVALIRCPTCGTRRP